MNPTQVHSKMIRPGTFIPFSDGPWPTTDTRAFSYFQEDPFEKTAHPTPIPGKIWAFTPEDTYKNRRKAFGWGFDDSMQPKWCLRDYILEHPDFICSLRKRSVDTLVKALAF